MPCASEAAACKHTSAGRKKNRFKNADSDSSCIIGTTRLSCIHFVRCLQASLHATYLSTKGCLIDIYNGAGLWIVKIGTEGLQGRTNLSVSCA